MSASNAGRSSGPKPRDTSSAPPSASDSGTDASSLPTSAGLGPRLKKPWRSNADSARKLTPEQVREIRAHEGPYYPLRHVYGVAPSTLCRIRKRQVYQDVE